MKNLSTKGPRRPWQPEREPQGRRLVDMSALYNSRRWRKDRARYLSQRSLCAHCEALGLVVAATVSDHIRPIRDGGAIWGWGNRQPLCSACHNTKSGKEAHDRQ